MNRHHYSLHVHNCRLVLLLRRSPRTGVDTESLEPGEWRWRLPEVCDKMWHHYVIAVDMPAVELFVDGRKFTENKHNPEILTHGPLHASKHVHSTKLVVGACWMGRDAPCPCLLLLANLYHNYQIICDNFFILLNVSVFLSLPFVAFDCFWCVFLGYI